MTLDQQHTMSEEMVKLIFNSLRESLAKTSTSIDNSTAEISKLVESLSNLPNKSDLKDIIQNCFKEIESDTFKSLTQIDNQLTTKISEQTKILVENNDKLKSSMEYSTAHVLQEIGKLNESVGSMTSKLDIFMTVIGIAFGIAMTAWGVVAFIFNFNN